MDDRRAQFLILVGDLCLAAQSARLPVVFTLNDGTELRGVPVVSSASPQRDEVDDTGFANLIAVDGAQARLDRVERCTVTAPL